MSEDQNTEKQDPMFGSGFMSDLTQAFIQLHEMHQEAIAAGFTEQQAMEIVKTILTGKQ